MPTRRARLAIIVLGTAIGFPMFIGGVLADVPVLAVAAIGGLGIGSVLLAARVRVGQVAMTLSLPMVGVGLSYPDVGKAAELAGLMVLGSIFGCVVSMFWPERTPAQAPPLRRNRRSDTAFGSVPPAPRQRQSASGSTSSTWAGRAQPRCW